jgi:DNA mismatch repair protein MutS
VLTTANHVLAQLEGAQQQSRSSVDAPLATMSESTVGQLGMFEVRDDVIRARIAALDTNNLTPLQALQELNELKGMLDA